MCTWILTNVSNISLLKILVKSIFLSIGPVNPHWVTTSPFYLAQFLMCSSKNSQMRCREIIPLYKPVWFLYMVHRSVNNHWTYLHRQQHPGSSTYPAVAGPSLLGFHLGMCTWEHICPKVPFWSSQSYLKENCGLAYSSENKTQACVCLILHKTHAFCTQMRLDTNDTVVPFKLWTPAMLWIVFGVCKALQPSALARIYVALFITLRSQRKMLL